MVRAAKLTPFVLCLVVGVASGKDVPSARERAWANTVTRAIGGAAVTVEPTKSERQLTVTYDDTRVTRTLAADPEEALAVARSLVEHHGGGAQLIEVRGRQVVRVEAMLIAQDGLPAILEAAWRVLPGGGEPRAALAMIRRESVFVHALGALGGGALRDLASSWTDGMNAGGYMVGETLLVQDSNELRARRVGATDVAFALSRHTSELRELLSQFGRLTPHGLQVDEPPVTGEAGEDRGESRDATVTGDAPAPTERPDLTGAWAVHDQDDGPLPAGGSPDMVRFSKRVAGEPDRYDVVFITSTGETKGQATFDGQTLVVERAPAPAPAKPASVGFVRVIDRATGRATDLPASQRKPAVTETSQQGRYTLRASARELEFTVVGQAAPDGPAPVHAFRRLAEPEVVCPAEWEASEEVLWAAGSAFREFGLVGVYAAALRSTSGVTHRIFASSSVDELFLDEQLASSLGEAQLDKLDALEVTVRPVGSGSVWVRDFGPITVRCKTDGARVAGDMGYFSSRPEDDRLPQDYAATRGWDVIDLQRLKLEGGNFMSDGRGKVYVTGRALEGSYQGANSSQRAVEDALFELGAREVCWVPRMTHADGTGHIDMFSKLLSASSVLVGRDASGPHAAMLDDAARRYEAMGLSVLRVDMAHNPAVDARARDLQTYTNALFIGRVAIVPQYDVAESDQAALAVYRRAGYTAVGADVRAVIGANGAIHCVSMQIPGGK